jgi:hypothetical protein
MTCVFMIQMHLWIGKEEQDTPAHTGPELLQLQTIN